MIQNQVFDLSPYSLEKHVTEALSVARDISNSEELNAGDIINAATSISDDSSSVAYSKIGQILNVQTSKSQKGSKIDITPPLLNEISLAPELAESFVIGEEFLKENTGVIWGRDLITLALLATNDQSLKAIFSEAGKSAEIVRNEWYSFVTSDSKRRSIEKWTQWWNKAGITPGGPDPATIKSYLLLWNPALYPIERFRKNIRQVVNSSDSITGWSMGNRKNSNIGDRVFLLRKGDNAGIVGFGTIAGEITQEPDYKTPNKDSGKTFNMAPIAWEKLLEEPVISQEELLKIDGGKSLTKNMAGGIEIPSEASAELYELWQEGLKKLIIRLKIKIYSDKPTSAHEDTLGYINYANTISGIIKDNKDNDPYNIGIIAPWGHGKTTLMEFIREDFESDFREEKPYDSNQSKTTIKDLKLWLSTKNDGLSKIDKSKENLQTSAKSNNSNRFKKTIKGFRTRRKARNDGLFKFEKFGQNHPTIWFNAWKYQSSEQIWAGIGHAIITQLVSKLEQDQEKFWYWLRSGRIDKLTLLRKLQNYIYKNSPLVILLSIITIGLFIGSWLLLKQGDQTISLLTLIAGGGSGFWSFKNLEKIIKNLKTEVSGEFADIVNKPDYKEKLGLYHQLTDDLQTVFKTLIDPMKPAIVFIDDLDRCSPEVVADVMEAINLIMTNPQVGKHCYFIFGMDAQVIAAALDHKYSSLQGKLLGMEHTYGSVGWYFLDKFIQLPFIIPIINSEEKKKFLSDFFVDPTEEEGENYKEEATKKKILDIGKAVKNKEEGKITKIIKETKNPEEKRKLQKAIIDESIKHYKEDSEDIIEQLAYLSDYLSSSPREIKRFVNLLILHNVHQNLRFHESPEIPSNKEIARWLLISIKWPQLVRWIQWEDEQNLVSKNTPQLKARKIDELVKEFTILNKSKDLNSPEQLKKWHNYLVKEKADKLEWLKDKQLFQVLVAGNWTSGDLTKALRCRVW